LVWGIPLFHAFIIPFVPLFQGILPDIFSFLSFVNLIPFGAPSIPFSSIILAHSFDSTILFSLENFRANSVHSS
jgi:hypothetical protein